MASIDEEFKVLVRSTHVEEEFAEQLEHAARTLATSGSVASAITSVRSIPCETLPAVRALAERLAERYGLEVTVESTTMCHVRFARRGSEAT